ncbi:MAG: hypothetical protein EXS01_04100 [Phycisphaerales bacterium]|nr:hypothetical protein [Phycisphaerales bacterium]
MHIARTKAGWQCSSQVIDWQGTGSGIPRAGRSKTLGAIFAVILTGAVGAINCGCKSTPGPMVPPLAVGRWRGAESAALLEFTDSGIFVVELADKTTLLGRCAFSGSRVVMRYQLGAALCPEELGQYTLEFDAVKMTASDPADTCADRRSMMAQVWIRDPK